MVGNPNNPLTESSTYSGKVYRLSSTQGRLSLQSLHDQLSDTTIHLDPPSEYEDDEELVKPDVFKKNGQIKIITTIEEVEIVESDRISALSGNIVLDETGSVVFRDNRVLILDTESVRFVVFRDGDDYYIVLIAGRNLVENVLEIIAEELEKLDLSLLEVNLTSEDINHIADQLAEELLNTTFQDYPQSSINKKFISGRGYQSEPEYQEEKKRGSVRTHMMATEEVGNGEKVISISEDALVRSYSKLELETYLTMIQDYLLPQISTQSTVTDFTTPDNQSKVNDFNDKN
jgi:Pyruvate/2-oxoacid:ferredoxin oxidoreductase gamma subunit